MRTKDILKDNLPKTNIKSTLKFKWNFDDEIKKTIEVLWEFLDENLEKEYRTRLCRCSPDQVAIVQRRKTWVNRSSLGYLPSGIPTSSAWSSMTSCQWSPSSRLQPHPAMCTDVTGSQYPQWGPTGEDGRRENDVTRPVAGARRRARLRLDAIHPAAPKAGNAKHSSPARRRHRVRARTRHTSPCRWKTGRSLASHASARHPWNIHWPIHRLHPGGTCGQKSPDQTAAIHISVNAHRNLSTHFTFFIQSLPDFPEIAGNQNLITRTVGGDDFADAPAAIGSWEIAIFQKNQAAALRLDQLELQHALTCSSQRNDWAKHLANLRIDVRWCQHWRIWHWKAFLLLVSSAPQAWSRWTIPTQVQARHPEPEPKPSWNRLSPWRRGTTHARPSHPATPFLSGKYSK